MKRTILITGGVLCASLLSAQEKRPNIILILADDMRGTTPQYRGKEETKTPFLNQFAKESTVFTNAHIMGGSNGAVSMPSRAMLITGKYVYNLEKQGALIPQTHTTLGEALNSTGYETFHIGKWHADRASFNRCYTGGDDIFFGGMADHWNVPLFHYDPSGKYENRRPVIENMLHSNKIKFQQGQYSYSGKHSVDVFTDRAIEFIGEHSQGDKPFFLSLCYMSPHDPRSTHEEFMNMYDTLTTALPKNFMLEHPFDNGDMKLRDEVLSAYPRQEAEVRRHIAEYYAMITHLDRRVGDVIRALRESGQYDNTVIIFTADNGLAVGQHGLMGKQNVYEHSVGVPLIIKAQGQDAPKGETDKFCYLIDLFPTICELAGEQKPASVDGISLLPILKNGTAVRDHLYYGYRDLQRAVSDGEWKLIIYRVNGTETTQLFNLKNDPMEINNLIADKKYAKTVERLHKLMQQGRVETNDNTDFWKN